VGLFLLARLQFEDCVVVLFFPGAGRFPRGKKKQQDWGYLGAFSLRGRLFEGDHWGLAGFRRGKREDGTFSKKNPRTQTIWAVFSFPLFAGLKKTGRGTSGRGRAPAGHGGGGGGASFPPTGAKQKKRQGGEKTAKNPAKIGKTGPRGEGNNKNFMKTDDPINTYQQFPFKENFRRKKKHHWLGGAKKRAGPFDPKKTVSVFKKRRGFSPLIFYRAGAPNRMFVGNPTTVSPGRKFCDRVPWGDREKKPKPRGGAENGLFLVGAGRWRDKFVHFTGPSGSGRGGCFTPRGFRTGKFSGLGGNSIVLRVFLFRVSFKILFSQIICPKMEIYKKGKQKWEGKKRAQPS